MLGVTPPPIAVEGVLDYLDEEWGDFTYPGDKDHDELIPIEVDIQSSIE